MFAAYNAGPATVGAHSPALRGLPEETRNYVRGIARILGSKLPVSESVDAANSPIKRAEPMSAPKPMPESTLVSLTRPDGVLVDVDAATVTSIRVPIPDEWAPGVQTVLSMGLRRQGVLESPDTVIAMLRSHGARI
jgi:hypothetical protein